jgi:integrase
MVHTDYLFLAPNGIYYYRRRVPSHIVDITSKKLVKISLKTRDRKIAKTKSVQLNSKMEDLWDDLTVNGQNGQDVRYRKAVKTAQLYGFQYMPAHEIAQHRPEEIIRRLAHITNNDISSTNIKTDALLGGVVEPQIMLSNCIEKLIEVSRADLARKSPAQKKRWIQEKEHVVQEMISICGDKPIGDLNRQDLMRLKDKMIRRYEIGEIRAHTVNRKFEKLKAVISKINKGLQLDIDTSRLFADLRIADDTRRRKAFSRDYIDSVILNDALFKNLNKEARAAQLIMLNTGMRPSEFCGFDASDIVLDHEIPHVIVREKMDEERKSKQSIRIIPLTGISLEVMKAFPKGFKQYYRKASNLSACLCKYYRDNNIPIKEGQTPLYSIRHSFQDFLRQNKVDRRIQCVLMGHDFKEMEYGEPSLEEKLEAIQTFAF